MELIAKLRDRLGTANVLTGADTDRYARDQTGKYNGNPLAVVRPGTSEQAATVLRLANDTRTAVVPIAGNTGLVGGTYADAALMISVERLNRIREIRRQARVAVVEAGVILSSLHTAAEAEDLIFPLIFGARGSAMIGGVLSTNAGGSNVVRYGNTRALTLGIEVALADGRVMNLMNALHKDNTGYDLKDLFIGAEGTLGLITAAVLKLAPKPRAYATAMVAVPDLKTALTLLNRLQQETSGLVEAFEYMPACYMERLALCRPDLRQPFAKTYPVALLIELGATAPRDATPLADGSLPIVNLLERTLAGMLDEGVLLDAVVARSDAQRKTIWARREVAAEITFSRKPIVDTDVSLPLDRIATFVEQMQARLPELDADAQTITVGHLGDGNLHYTVWPSRDDFTLNDTIRDAVEGVATDLGGSFSAEHGIGLSKKSSMARRKDPVATDVMAQIKSALDPRNIMNPGKVLP